MGEALVRFHGDCPAHISLGEHYALIIYTVSALLVALGGNEGLPTVALRLRTVGAALVDNLRFGAAHLAADVVIAAVDSLLDAAGVCGLRDVAAVEGDVDIALLDWIAVVTLGAEGDIRPDWGNLEYGESVRHHVLCIFDGILAIEIGGVRRVRYEG